MLRVQRSGLRLLLQLLIACLVIVLPRSQARGFTQVLPPFTGASDFITGFPTCSVSPNSAGPTGVLFDGTDFFATDFCNQTTYRFGSSGGDASSPDAALVNGLDLGLAYVRGAYYGVSAGLGVYTFDPVSLATTFITPPPSGTLRGVIGDPLSTDIFVSTTGGIYAVHNPTSGSPTVSTITGGSFDGITITEDGTVLYAATQGSIVFGYDRTGTQVFSVDIGHPADGIAVALGNTSVNGVDVSNNVFANCLDGTIVRIDVNNGNAVSVVASGGTRGDLVSVGPDNCLYVTQSDRVIKLSPCFFQPSDPDPCGNGLVGPLEECDDGNTEDGDCCSATCEYETVGSSCGDGNVCNGEELCDGAGTCGAGTPLDCNDGDFCTQDSCDAVTGCANATEPAVGCASTWSKGLLLVKEKVSGKEKFLLKMIKGPAITQTDLGDPLSPGGTSYGVCVYDAAGALAGRLEIDRAGAACAGKDCWKTIGKHPPDGKGFKYKDKDTTADGVKVIRFKGGDTGRTVLLVKGANNAAKGQTELPLGIAAGLQSAAGATIQVLGGPQCYEVTVTDIKKQESDFFKAK